VTPITWKLTDESGDDSWDCVRCEPYCLDPRALTEEEGKVWDLLIFGPEIPEPGMGEGVSYEEGPSQANEPSYEEGPSEANR
jgi:hypothetical protein